MASVRGNEISNKKNNRKNYKSTHIRRKRPACKLSKAENVIYCNSKSHLKSFLSSCEKLIRKDFNQIVVYCMGASISKGICLALEVCEKYPIYQCHTKTFTTEVTDDLEPTVDEEDFELQKRNKSTVEITLFKTIPTETESSTKQCSSQPEK